MSTSTATGLNEYHFDIVANHFQDTLMELGAGKELVDEAVAILMTSRPIFERKRDPREDVSSHGGSENIAAVAGHLQELLLASDEELTKTRQEVKRLVSKTRAENMVRLRSALKMRGPGLVGLLDQAMAVEDGTSGSGGNSSEGVCEREGSGGNEMRRQLQQQMLLQQQLQQQQQGSNGKKHGGVDGAA